MKKFYFFFISFFQLNGCEGMNDNKKGIGFSNPESGQSGFSGLSGLSGQSAQSALKSASPLNRQSKETLVTLADSLKPTVSRDKNNTESLLDKIASVIREYENFKGSLMDINNRSN